jgi:quaternary ammonium compound-resistance protein SugE
MPTPWIYLLIAGLFEIGWPLGFKLSQTTGHKVLWIAFAAISMALSGLFLWLAQKTIPVGTAYAVWTGIGAAGTFIIGVLFFKDAASMMRILSVMLIIAGVIGLRLSHG